MDTQGDVGLWTSVAVDSDDYPHISYYDATNTRLKYATWTGSTWSTEVVDDPPKTDVGQYTSLALDPTYPAVGISYYDFTNEDLKYAISNECVWSIEVADDGNGDNVGQYTSLAFTSSGHPCISYYDDTDDDLLYAEGTPTDLTSSPWLEREGSESARFSFFSQSLPNPFTHRTMITYDLPASARISLRVYDLTGCLVKTLIDQPQAAGDHSVLWDGRDDQGKDVPAGVYFYKIEARQTDGSPTTGRTSAQAGGSLYSGKTVLIR